MKCKYDDNIQIEYWIVKDLNTQIEFLKRKELKREICDEFCDKTEQRICKILTSIPN
jgi:hypothetical protein